MDLNEPGYLDTYFPGKGIFLEKYPGLSLEDEVGYELRRAVYKWLMQAWLLSLGFLECDNGLFEVSVGHV